MASTLINGTPVGELYEGRRFFVVVWGVPEVRRRLTSQLQIDTPLGLRGKPLGDVADVMIVPAPNAIQRDGASRRIDVICNATGRDLGGVAEDVEAAIAEQVDFKHLLSP
ncbi:MAG: hypothetical protein R3C02_03200 [Planctomycetaceae bacterium]